MPDSLPVWGVTGDHTIEGRPLGFSSLTPFIVVPDPAAALKFYETVFGAQVLGITEMPHEGNSVIVHAELAFALGRLQLGAAHPAFHLVLPPGDGMACYSLGLYVPDVDAVVARALTQGATLREAVSTFVSGDRYGSLLDPFGVRWSVMTRVEDVSDAESQARVDAWAKEAGAP